MSGDDTPMPADKTIGVELWIDTNIHDAAVAQAKRQREKLAPVCRTALEIAAAAAPVARNPGRPRASRRRESCTRVRFRMSKDIKDDVTHRINATGLSIHEAVERYLREYIKSGSIIRKIGE
jgi:hypothetical protein